MNSGPNQHYIPAFVQRAFGISPRKREIWYVEREKQPTKRAIKRTGSQDNFYSEPTAKSVFNLDAKITESENSIAKLLHTIRSTVKNKSVDPEHAAAIVAHLAPRTAHIRNSLKQGMSGLLEEAKTVLLDAENIKSMVGLDHSAPNKRFRSQIFSKISKQPEISKLPVPEHVLERIAFYFARENISSFMDNSLLILAPAFDKFLKSTGSLTRDSHNKALEQMLQSNPREIHLREFSWTVEYIETPRAILPDCVVIAIRADGEAVPFMLAGKDEIKAVILPISPRQLLVGFRNGYELPQSLDYNLEAARCSYSFFLSSCNDAEVSRLRPFISEGAKSILNEAIEKGFSDFRTSPGDSQFDKAQEQTETPFWPTGLGSRHFQYELSFRSFGNYELVELVGAQIRCVVSELSEVLPLDRLDGITIAGDYPAALQEIERGFENTQSVEAMSCDVGVGIAKMVTVLRCGKVKGHVVISGGIGQALTGEDGDQRNFGLYVVVKQFVLVAMIEFIEAALPGTFLSQIDGELDGWLYGQIDGALNAYVAARIAAGFGDVETIFETKSELLADSLEHMQNTVLKEKLAYRRHRNIDRLSEIALPCVRQVLIFAADLLGHCGNPESRSPQESDNLLRVLEQVGLKNWLEIYRNDLEQFYRKLGRWNSFDEFLVLNIHVERVFWQLGMVPWLTREGVWIEIFFGTDTMGLISRNGK
ncbi:DUF4238 domain-containing protein [Candidatus Poribacteria bacterium]|nr:DUF4238 domain-containing protein [Candidatus Poribacteria bacterium]